MYKLRNNPINLFELIYPKRLLISLNIHFIEFKLTFILFSVLTITLKRLKS